MMMVLTSFLLQWVLCLESWWRCYKHGSFLYSLVHLTTAMISRKVSKAETNSTYVISSSIKALSGQKEVNSLLSLWPKRSHRRCLEYSLLTPKSKAGLVATFCFTPGLHSRCSYAPVPHFSSLLLRLLCLPATSPPLLNPGGILLGKGLEGTKRKNNSVHSIVSLKRISREALEVKGWNKIFYLFNLGFHSKSESYHEGQKSIFLFL